MIMITLFICSFLLFSNKINCKKFYYYDQSYSTFLPIYPLDAVWIFRWPLSLKTG